MRRLCVLLSALVLGVAMALPVAMPVAAAPGDHQPVGWVHWEGNVTPNIWQAVAGQAGHFDGSAMVKKYADGTIEGFFKSTNFVTNEQSYCAEFVSVDFLPDHKTAVITGWFHEPMFGPGLTLERYTLVDNGEPGYNNDQMMLEFSFDGGVSWFPWPYTPVPEQLWTHGNIQVHSAR